MFQGEFISPEKLRVFKLLSGVNNLDDGNTMATFFVSIAKRNRLRSLKNDITLGPVNLLHV